jgi:hypothetical protein
MDRPAFKTSVKDVANNVTWHVTAYRKLSSVEAIHQVKIHLAGLRKKPPKNKTLILHTILGA